MNSGQETMGRAVGDRHGALSEGVPVGYKCTEVGVIPEDWECLRFGDAVNLLTGFPFPSSGYVNSGVLLVRGSNVKRGTMDWGDEITQYWPTITSEIARYELRKGDLVIAMDGALVGRSYAVISDADLPSLLLQRVARIRSSRLHQDMLVFLVANDSFLNYVDAVKTHTAIPHISPEDIRGFLIAVPTNTNEQRAIAEALSDVDGLLATLEALIAKKRAIKQAAMQQLLTGKTRLPGFNGEWETKRLGDISDVDPENLPSGTNPDFTFNYISLEQVDAGRLLGYSEERFCTAPSRARRVLRYGDVLMSTVRPGLMAHLLYREQIPNAVCSTGFAVLRAKPHLSDPAFLFFHLLGHVVNKQIEKTLAGSNYPAINGRDVRLLEIPCPPQIQAQRAIAAVLSDMDAEITALERRRDKTYAVKQGMMQQLLMGRVRLVEPETTTEGLAAAISVEKKRNWQFNEAVVVSVLAKYFGNEQYPLGRMRYTKLSYLLHRRERGHVEGYLKKAAGPYNPQTRYGGPENIALQKDYVRRQRSGKRQGFVSSTNIDEAEHYFDKWYGIEVLQWMEQFRYKTNNDLELLTTVDMASEELLGAGEEISVERVKEVIHSNPEWKPKLTRPIFSDANLARAIENCQKLFDLGGKRILS